jgi:hypothetical protein
LRKVQRIEELAIPKIGRPQVWYTGCHMEGHHVSECPRFRGGRAVGQIIQQTEEEIRSNRGSDYIENDGAISAYGRVCECIV